MNFNYIKGKIMNWKGYFVQNKARQKTLKNGIISVSTCSKGISSYYRKIATFM